MASSCSSTPSASAISPGRRSISSTRSPAAASRSRTRTRRPPAAAASPSVSTDERAWPVGDLVNWVFNHHGAGSPIHHMDRPLPDLTSLRPQGGKRSTKRDRIVEVFLRQEGHISADDLFERIRREASGIGRATVYRTLQWMVDAGIARKVDFGEGRSRYEPSYRHPRHFHLICTTCHSSSEFLSSDVEALMEEIAAARNFAAV